MPACAGMTAVNFFIFMFFYAAYFVFPNHDNSLSKTIHYFLGQQWS